MIKPLTQRNFMCVCAQFDSAGTLQSVGWVVNAGIYEKESGCYDSALSRSEGPAELMRKFNQMRADIAADYAGIITLADLRTSHLLGGCVTVRPHNLPRLDNETGGNVVHDARYHMRVYLTELVKQFKKKLPMRQ